MKSLDIVFPSAGVVTTEQREVLAPGPDEILCEASRSLLSTGTETFCLAGEFDDDTFWKEWVHYPFNPGYSMASTVIGVGSAVTGFHLGDRVASASPHQQRFCIPQSSALPIPDDITDEQACWMSLACTTQLGVRRAQLELGETVGVIGLGLLGQLVVRYLRLCGTARIVCIDVSAERLELARQGGATELIQSDAATARDSIAHSTDGRMLDAVFDVTGHHSVLAPASQLLRPLGRLILLGDSPSPSKQNLGPRIVADSLSILAVHASAAPPVATARDRWSIAAMTELFFEFVRSTRMHVDDLVSHRFIPSEAAEVYARLRADRSGYLGVIFDWTGLHS
jgi:2-desacetyl-2-hydroxyethyl bacteriochlorophyllide A dehydrogenase